MAACTDGQWLARALHERGVPLALVTGARRSELDLVLRRFDFGAVFAATVSADDVVVGKPDPEPYLRGAAALGLLASECLVIEDAVAGLRSAEAAGAAVIVVDRLGDPGRFAPQRPVARLDEGVWRRSWRGWHPTRSRQGRRGRFSAGSRRAPWRQPARAAADALRHP